MFPLFYCCGDLKVKFIFTSYLTWSRLASHHTLTMIEIIKANLNWWILVCGQIEKCLKTPIIFLSNHEPYCHSRSLRPPYFRTYTVTIHTWNMINVVQEKAVRPSQLLPGYMKCRVLWSEFLYERESCALMDNSCETSRNTSRINCME